MAVAGGLWGAREAAGEGAEAEAGARAACRDVGFRGEAAAAEGVFSEQSVDVGGYAVGSRGRSKGLLRVREAE